jgi:hypothetical protein
MVPAESGLRPSCQFSLSSSFRALMLLIVAWAVQAPFASAQVFWGLTENQSLVRFDRADPATPIATLPITGMPADEPLVGIEVQTPDGALAVAREKTIEPNSRLTINPEVEDPSLASVAVATHVVASAPIVAERAQYWPFSADQWFEAHDSVGQAEAGTHWGLAEGRVGGPQNHQTYILLADTGTNQAGSFVTVRFIREHGPLVTKQFRLARFGRLTIHVGSAQVPEITVGAFGVEITSSAPIQVERSMYFDSGSQVWAAGTNATATRLP